MNTKMKMAKVIKITTHANENGHIMEVVSAIDANITPEQFIARLDLIASIKSYEVTKPMPLPYMTTRFFRFLVSIRTSTQDMPPRAYAFVPMQDFSKTWTDKELYEKYKLTEEEIAFIEDTIPPMEL